MVCLLYFDVDYFTFMLVSYVPNLQIEPYGRHGHTETVVYVKD